MTLRLIREPSVKDVTLGSLYVNGVWFSWCLEDAIREVPGQPVSAWKVPGQTAIPAGRYRVVINRSQRFNRMLPQLLDVPGFSGVRIHPGNTIEDTEGCLLLGYDRFAGAVGRSRAACEALLAKLMDEPSECWISIENPAAEQAA